MNRDDIRDAIHSFLALVESESEPAGNLKLALDRLALAYHYSECDFDEANYADTPERDYNEMWRTVAVRFPDYGFYNVAHHISINVGESDLSMGDAIDDIADIALEMYEVSWLWDNGFGEQALWHFKRSYNYHWGEHLRSLQFYLQAQSRDQ